MIVRRLVLSLMLAATAATPAWAADDRGTADEAKAMFDKALALVKASGPEAAFAAFNAGGEWKVKDLYVFCLSYEGAWKAMGAKPNLVGKVALDLHDASGKFLTKEMIEVAKTKGMGTVNYQWANTVTNKVEPKTSYIGAIGNDHFCGVGYYH